MNKQVRFFLCVASLLAATTRAHAIPIGGVEFPQGLESFADAVVSYSPGTNVGPGYDDPAGALGVPDYSASANTAVSLGIGGELILKFSDNSLTTSGDSAADIWIFEVGDVTERFNVGISADNVSWIDLGDVLGQPTGIDIDSIAGVTQGALYSFVRLRDIAPNQSGFPFGEADIDAVGAISSAPPVSVPEPGALVLLSLGLIGVGLSRKRGRDSLAD